MDVVLVQFTGEPFGKFRHLGETQTLDLSLEDFGNPQRWEPLEADLNS